MTYNLLKMSLYSSSYGTDISKGLQTTLTSGILEKKTHLVERLLMRLYYRTHEKTHNKNAMKIG